MEAVASSLFVITAIIGFVQAVKAVASRNYETAIIIIGAALIGCICGYFHIDNLDVLTGIQAGLASAGSYTGLALVGGKYNQQVSP